MKIDVQELLSSWGVPKSTLSLANNGTNWSRAGKADVCNDIFVVAIIEVIAGYKVPTENKFSGDLIVTTMK